MAARDLFGSRQRERRYEADAPLRRLGYFALADRNDREVADRAVRELNDPDGRLGGAAAKYLRQMLTGRHDPAVLARLAQGLESWTGEPLELAFNLMMEYGDAASAPPVRKLLESGRADAFVMDGQILAGNIAKAKNPADFRIVGEVLSVEPIAIMMRKDDPAFKKAVDDSLVAMMKSGEIAKLYDKWFMQPIPPTNVKVGLPASEATKQAWANPNDKPLEDYLKK